MIIIIPAYNEEKRIASTLKAYLDFFNDIKIVVSLSNCTDQTETVVEDISKLYPHKLFWVKSHPVYGNSKGKAIRDGWEYTINNFHSDWLGFIDADNSVTPREFDKLIQKKGGNDAVISSRYLPESYLKERESLLRIVASHFYRHFVAWLFRFPFLDTQCGGKIYRTEAIKKIIPMLRVNDMTFDVEILFLLQKYGFKIVEEPIFWRENLASTISTSKNRFIKTSLEMFWSLIKLRIRFWVLK